MKLTDVGDPRKGESACPVAESGALIEMGQPTLVVFGVRRGDLRASRFAAAVCAALTRSSAGQPPERVMLYLLQRGTGPFEAASDERARPFLDAGASVVRAGRVGPDADTLDALLASWAAADGPGVRVCLGTDFAARARASTVVAVTGGLPQTAFSPAARSVDHRVQLHLVEPRVRVAEGLARRLLERTPALG